MMILLKFLAGCIATLHCLVALYMLSILVAVFIKKLPASYLHIQTAIIGISGIFHFTTGVCPLTFIEKKLRALAGAEVYEGNFLNYYSQHFFNISIPDQLIVRAIIVFMLVLIYMLMAQYLKQKKSVVV